MINYRDTMKDKKRVVVKIGSSSLVHPETGNLDLIKLERLVRMLCDLRNSGKDVVLVSSGAIGVGAKVLGLKSRPTTTSLKQACAAVGQGQLMMVYQKLFSEYHQDSAQVLITKYTMADDTSRKNAKNTFLELLNLGVVPIVNENDTVATEEIEIGDNDTLSAFVTSLVEGDLLILLSDIDGLYTDDPRVNPDATLLHQVDEITEQLLDMGKDTKTSLGTGGMATKLSAATIATKSGADMIIANGEKMTILNKIFQGEEVGTLFLANKDKDFNLLDYMKE
ncbi:MAG: glutamate 5-kinase [Lachnospiraceae bacterium]|nr:glutamate 5-kinase [Lachnospiraceae bacterium]